MPSLSSASTTSHSPVVPDGVGADLVHVGPDEERRPQARLHQDQREHRRGGGLAVGAGHGHAAAGGGDGRQHLGPRGTTGCPGARASTSSGLSRATAGEYGDQLGRAHVGRLGGRWPPRPRAARRSVTGDALGRCRSPCGPWRPARWRWRSCPPRRCRPRGSAGAPTRSSGASGRSSGSAGMGVHQLGHPRRPRRDGPACGPPAPMAASRSGSASRPSSTSASRRRRTRRRARARRRPASTSARALARLVVARRARAAGTSTAGTPATASSATVMAPARHTMTSAAA